MVRRDSGLFNKLWKLWGFWCAVMLCFGMGGVAGCVGAGPQVSIDRNNGGNGPAGGPEGGILPLPEGFGNHTLMSGSGGAYQSNQYRGYGITSYADGRPSKSANHQIIGTELGLASKRTEAFK